MSANNTSISCSPALISVGLTSIFHVEVAGVGSVTLCIYCSITKSYPGAVNDNDRLKKRLVGR